MVYFLRLSLISNQRSSVSQEAIILYVFPFVQDLSASNHEFSQEVTIRHLTNFDIKIAKRV